LYLPECMEPEFKEPTGGMAFAGFAGLIAGGVGLARTYIADLGNTPVFYKRGWVSPMQGYIGSSLCVAFGLVVIFLWISQLRSK
jgi:hypothetical protein